MCDSGGWAGINRGAGVHHGVYVRIILPGSGHAAPEWTAWFNNASTAIVAGANTGGTGYANYTNILNGSGQGYFDVRGLMITPYTLNWSGIPPTATFTPNGPGFTSWMGTADTGDGMYGNRFTFMYDLGSAGAQLDIRKVTLKVNTYYVGKNGSTDFTNYATGSFASDATGFGFMAQDTRSGYNWNGTSWVEVTSGYIADRIIIRSGVGFIADNIPGATHSEILDGLEQQLLGNKAWSDSGAFRQLSSYEIQVSYGGELTVSGLLQAVPEPTTIIIWSLLGGLGLVFVKWQSGRKNA